eukprot:scaffold17391_cov47-Phaeocystis_antarctica.AAC.3
MWHAPNHWKQVGTRLLKRLGGSSGGGNSMGSGDNAAAACTAGASAVTPPCCCCCCWRCGAVSESESEGSGESRLALCPRGRVASRSPFAFSSSTPADITRRKRGVFPGTTKTLPSALPANEHQLPSLSRSLLPGLSSSELT